MYKMTKVQKESVTRSTEKFKTKSILKKEKELKRLTPDSKRWKRKKREIVNLSKMPV